MQKKLDISGGFGQPKLGPRPIHGHSRARTGGPKISDGLGQASGKKSVFLGGHGRPV